MILGIMICVVSFIIMAVVGSWLTDGEATEFEKETVRQIKKIQDNKKCEDE